MGNLARTAVQVYSGLLAVAGIVLMFIPGAQPAGAFLMGMSGVINMGLAATAPSARVRSFQNSPHYGIGDFSNPNDPDTVTYLLYGTTRVVPTVYQEHVSSLAEGSGLGIAAVKKQGINILLGVAEGQVSDITDVRINDQPAMTEPEVDVKVGKGNGTRKEWELPGRFVYLPSLTVRVNGVEVAQVTSSVTSYPTLPANSNTIIFGRNKGEKILTETFRVYLNDVEEVRSGTYGWTIRKVTKKKARLHFKVRPPAGAKIKVTFSYLGATDLTIRQNGRGRTLLTFGTAPTNGHEILATYRRANFEGLIIETRPGTLDQEGIPGFGDFRNSKTVAAELTKDTERTHSTAGVVNDVRIGIAAPRGFTVFNTSGGQDIIRANLVIGYAWLDTTGTAGTKRTLYHLGDGDNAKPDFLLAGQSVAPRTWEIGLRDTLLGLVNAGYTDLGGFDLEDELATLSEGTRVKVFVTRKDVVRTDAQSLDGLFFQYATEVTDELFSYPGTALLAVRALVTAGLDGGAPTVTCKATRADLYDPRTGLWDGRSDNPALAAYDLITSGNSTAIQRYGSRGHFSSADVDSTTFNAWADYCDEYVHNDTSDKSSAASSTNGERRHSLNLVMDTPMSLSEWVADIAFVGGSFAVMQGVKWRFPLDKDGSATFAFTEDVDPTNANIVAGSLELGPEPIESTPTDIEVEYFDREREWQAEMVLASRGDLLETTPRRQVRVSARGVDRASEAERLAERILLHATNNPVPVTWLAHPGAIAPEAGDIVTVTSYVPGGTAATGWSAQKVRIIGMTREWPVDQRAPLLRYEARVLSDKPYAVTFTKVASPSGGNLPGSAAGSGPGTSGPPVSSNGGTFGVPGGGLKIGGFSGKVKRQGGK